MASFVKQAMQKFNILRSNLKELDLTDSYIDDQILSQDVLREIFESIDSVEDGWKYLRELPKGNNFMFNTDNIMKQIEDAYSMKPTSNKQSGTSYVIMMQFVTKIAKNGVDNFTNDFITNVRENLSFVLEEQRCFQRRQILISTSNCT